MDYTILDGKMVGGDGGKGVLIESVLFRFDTDQKTKEETAHIEIMGTAKTVMRDQWNPAAGWDDLAEPVPVKDSVKLALANDKVADNHILYENLQRIFEFDPPLADGDDTWQRFTEEGENSVLKKLVGGEVYFRAKKSNTKTGEKLGDYFFNIACVAKREEPKMANVKDKMAGILKKKEEAKKRKEAAEADLVGAGASDEGIPF
jgi:hypothetical protein